MSRLAQVAGTLSVSATIFDRRASAADLVHDFTQPVSNTAGNVTAPTRSATVAGPPLPDAPCRAEAMSPGRAEVPAV